MNAISNAFHSIDLKALLITGLGAAKQLSEAVEESSPKLIIAEPLTDKFFDALTARVQHLLSNQEAKAEAVNAVAASPETAAAAVAANPAPSASVTEAPVS